MLSIIKKNLEILSLLLLDQNFLASFDIEPVNKQMYVTYKTFNKNFYVKKITFTKISTYLVSIYKCYANIYTIYK